MRETGFVMTDDFLNVEIGGKDVREIGYVYKVR